MYKLEKTGQDNGRKSLSIWLFQPFIATFVNESYEQIEKDMSIAEVRRLLKDSFHESTASFSHIEKDGYPLDHYPFLDEKSVVNQYTYLPWWKLYFYVIYDEYGKVQLTIPAFE